MDPVNKKALKGKFKDREDKDIDNDGDVDSSDEYLHKRRKAVSKAISHIKEAVVKCRAEEKVFYEAYTGMPVNSADKKVVKYIDSNGKTKEKLVPAKRNLTKESVDQLDEISIEKLRDYASAALQDKNKAKADKRWKYASKAYKKIGDKEAKDANDRKYNRVNEERKGLWANIHAKRKRIENGSGEKMRKPGSEGAPTDADFKRSQKKD